MTRLSSSSGSTTTHGPSIRAKAAAAILSLIPSAAYSQENSTSAKPEPPAASSTDLAGLTLPKLDNPSQSPVRAALKLKGGFVLEQRDGLAAYSVNDEGRVSSIRFPNGYTISDISYHSIKEKEHLVAQLTITTGGTSATYTRNSSGDEIYQSWRVATIKSSSTQAGPEFNGDFEITSCGEFVKTDFSAGRNDRQIYTADGRVFLMRQLNSGAYFYDDKNGFPHALRRTDHSLVKITYSNGTPATITEEYNSQATRWWKLDEATQTWQCSDPNIAPSRRCPLYEKGTIAFTIGDGAQVSVATSGAYTLLSKEGLTTVVNPKGDIVRVALGARSRIFNYDADGELVSFSDVIGSRGTLTLIETDPSLRHRAERNGAINVISVETSSQSPETTTGHARFPTPFETPATTLVTLPRIQIHPHEAPMEGKSLCLKGVCPDTPPTRDDKGILFPLDAVAIGQESLISPKISTWTSLDTIEKQRGGALAPLVDFLRIWADTTSDEDIDRLTSPEALRLLQSGSGVSWLQPELISSTHADYLIWLRQCIRDNRLPCTLDIKQLTYPGLPNQALFGGVTGTVMSSPSRVLRISVDIQLLTFSEAALRADIREMLKHGGTGIYRPERFSSLSAINTLFHELQHVFVYATGREFEGTEPVAHVGAFLALASITPEKAGNYTKVLDRFRR